MTSKRDIEREIETLSDGTPETSAEPLILYFSKENNYQTRDAAPRPELTVPDPERDSYRVAAPNVIPDPYKSPILFLSLEVRETWPEPPGQDDGTVPVVRLWDEMDETHLRKERSIREENGDPIPPLLEQHN